MEPDREVVHTAAELMRVLEQAADDFRRARTAEDRDSANRRWHAALRDLARLRREQKVARAAGGPP